MRVYKSKHSRRLQVESLEVRHLLAADLRITEFLAANRENLADGDGEFSDWIEIEDAGDAVADLGGWYLTDDTDDLLKWPFPARQLEAGQHLLVFASAPQVALGEVVNDHVDSEGNLHANFQLRSGGEFLALADGTGAAPVIVREFASDVGEFPEQRDDISYGIGRLTDEFVLVRPDSPAKIHIPTETVAPAWQGAGPFDDAVKSFASKASSIG